MAWYNPSWSKRKKVTITETSGNNLTDYQVKLDVTYDADMNADFSDLRFTSSDETTLLNHWLESKTDSTSAIIWVKIPSLTASSDTDIYMYYGNSGASSASSGDDTFNFFDDFDGSSVDTSKWIIDNSTGISVSGGNLYATSTTGILRSQSTFSNAVSQILETKMTHVSVGANGYTPIGLWTSSTEGFSGLVYPGNPTTLYYRNDGTWVSISSTVPTPSTMLVKINFKSNNTCDIFYHNYSDMSTLASASNISNIINGERIRLIKRHDDLNPGQSISANWEWVRVRNYSTSEPTYIFSTEEDVPILYNLNILVNPVYGGTTIGQGNHEENTTINIEAIANEDYIFINWSGDITSSINPTTILMNEDKEIIANFVKVSGNLIFYPYEVAESKSFELNNGTITSAYFSADVVSGTFIFELTADGTNWEEVTNNTNHLFTNTGNDLRWRATENGGSTGIISKITISNY